jgi:hypothetical protein
MEVRRYTCKDYREEMVLAGLRKQLADPNLEEAEKNRLLEQIQQLENDIGLS